MRILVVAVGLLVALGARAEAEPIVGLTSTNSLIVFDSATPGTITGTVAVTGRQGGAGEVLQGIDIRPRTGALYALGVVAGATDTLRLYRLSPKTGVATQIGSPVTVTTGTFYGTDFNPVADRFRIVNTGDENLRLNPNNGARADSPTTDTDLNPAGQLIDGIAYDRNVDDRQGGTTLFGIARGSAALVRIGGVDSIPSPNGGVVTTVGALGVTPGPSAGVGFDISGATRTAYAAMQVGGATNLYTVNLSTGAATLVGAIGDGSPNLRGIAVLPSTRVLFGAEGKGFAAVVADGTLFPPFEVFPPKAAKSVRVALGDVNGDGIPDSVFGAGGKVPTAVKVFDGKTGSFAAQILPFELNAKVGVQVAAGDVDGDGARDVIAASGPGIPTEVRVFSGATLRFLGTLQPFGGEFEGGATVAAADLDLDGDAEIIVASGKGREPEVRIFASTLDVDPIAVLPVPLDTTKGLTVAAAAGAPATIAVGAAAGSADVVVLQGTLAGNVATFAPVQQLAAIPGGKKGVRVALADDDADGAPELFVIPAGGDVTAWVYDGATFVERETVTPFEAKGGFVAAGR